MARSKNAIQAELAKAVQEFLSSRPNQLFRQAELARHFHTTVPTMSRVVIDNSKDWPLVEDKDGGYVCYGWMEDWDEPLRIGKAV